MKTRLIQALSRLASTSYQEAYIVHGSKDEYVIPEDLVEDVASLCRLAQRPEFMRDFETPQILAMSAMVNAIGIHGPRLFSNPVATTADRLVHEDPDWAEIRRAASECLVKFGINAAELRANKIDSLE